LAIYEPRHFADFKKRGGSMTIPITDQFVPSDEAHGFPLIDGQDLLVGSVALAKLANLAQDQFIGRVTANTGVPETATITAAARTVLDDTSVALMLATIGGQTVDATLTALAGLTITQGSLIYGTGADAFSILAKGTAAQVLTMNAGATAPAWATSTAGDMVLATTQVVTGLKTFTYGKFALRGSDDESVMSIECDPTTNKTITFPNSTCILAMKNVGQTFSGTQVFGTMSSTALSATGTAALPIVTMTGKMTTYNGIATVGNGVPSILATVDLTAQAAAIAATTIYAVPASGAGLYRVSWVATITTVDATACTLGGTTGFRLTYTDADDSVVKTIDDLIYHRSATNSTATSISGAVVAYCKASTNLQYLFGYLATGGQMRYNLHAKVDFLG
jgi:hypothetical protein